MTAVDSVRRGGCRGSSSAGRGRGAVLDQRRALRQPVAAVSGDQGRPRTLERHVWSCGGGLFGRRASHRPVLRGADSPVPFGAGCGLGVDRHCGVHAARRGGAVGAAVRRGVVRGGRRGRRDRRRAERPRAAGAAALPAIDHQLVSRGVVRGCDPRRGDGSGRDRPRRSPRCAPCRVRGGLRLRRRDHLPLPAARAGYRVGRDRFRRNLFRGRRGSPEHVCGAGSAGIDSDRRCDRRGCRQHLGDVVCGAAGRGRCGCGARLHRGGGFPVRRPAGRRPAGGPFRSARGRPGGRR